VGRFGLAGAGAAGFWALAGCTASAQTKSRAVNRRMVCDFIEVFRRIAKGQPAEGDQGFASVFAFGL
jgi:hypothetical protein